MELQNNTAMGNEKIGEKVAQALAKVNDLAK
jgi:hypothetical protein